MTQPVSVIMPAYNAERYIEDAVMSLIGQTHADWEVVIVDDASRDSTLEIVRELAVGEPRIRVVVSESNLGVSGAANLAVEHARHGLLARLDADDLSEPERLRSQIELFERDAGLVLAGTAATIIDEEGAVVGAFVPPTDDRSIRRYFVSDNPFIHSSVMFRRSAFEAAGRYAGARLLEDYALWMLMADLGRIANLPELLVRHRSHAQSVMGRLTLRKNRMARLRCQWHAARRAPGPHALWPLARSVASLALPRGKRRRPSNI